MKTFCELLDTDPQIEIQINLDSVYHSDAPYTTVTVNDILLFDSTLIEKVHLQCSIALLSPIQINIGIKNKHYDVDKETAVVIKQITIDQFTIIPNYTQLATYVNDHQNNNPTSYLGFNGTWSLTIPEPFYRWKHHVTGQGWLLDPI